jgi:hypothetical protein
MELNNTNSDNSGSGKNNNQDDQVNNETLQPAKTIKPPSPMLGIVVFFGLTIIYFVGLYYVDNYDNVLFMIYLIALLSLQILSNGYLTQVMCGSPQWKTSIKALIPWVLIFGILYLLLLVFPSWLRPFSNTFGYGVAKFFGLRQVMENIISPAPAPGDKWSKDPTKRETQQTLANIYEDPSLLINEIPATNEGLTNFLAQMGDANLLTPNSGQYDKQLLDLLKLKDLVAKFIWFGLTGLLTVSVAYNYVITTSCSSSVKEMQRRHEEYLTDINKKKTKVIPPKIYTHTE